MKHILYLVLIGLGQLGFSQEVEPSYVAISDAGYFEIFDNGNTLKIIEITAKMNKLVSDTLKIQSLKEFKAVYNPELLRATKKLEKEWIGKEDLGYQNRSGYVHSIEFLKNGNQIYWYLNGADSDIDQSYWCSPKELKYFIRENSDFDVVFAVKDDNLGAYWKHRSKKLEGHSARLFDFVEVSIKGVDNGKPVKLH